MRYRQLGRSALKVSALCLGAMNFGPRTSGPDRLLHRPGIASTIIGPRSREQLISVLHAPEISLDEAALTAIEAIFPGVGPAPEAYAW